MFIFSFFVWVASKNIAYGKNMFAIYFTTASTAIFVTTVGTTAYIDILGLLLRRD